MPSILAKEIEHILFSFDTTSSAMAALDKTEHLEGTRLIPLPTEIGAGCGFCLRVEKKELENALNILDKADYHKVYTLYHEGKKRVIEEYVLW